MFSFQFVLLSREKLNKSLHMNGVPDTIKFTNIKAKTSKNNWRYKTKEDQT